MLESDAFAVSKGHCLSIIMLLIWIESEKLFGLDAQISRPLSEINNIVGRNFIDAGRSVGA